MNPPRNPFSSSKKSLHELRDEFYLWIGFCIAGWATAEHWLFQICWKSLGCTKERAAIVYYRLPTLEVRIGLTQELVEHVLPKTIPGKSKHPDLRAWEGIAKAFESLKQTRNRIAHHPVAPRTMTGGMFGQPFNTVPFGAVVRVEWFEIDVSETERLRGRHTKINPLTIADLKKHLDATGNLSESLKNFSSDRLPPHL